MKLKNKIHLYSTVLFIVLIITMNVAIYHTFSQLTINSELERVKAETVNIASGVNQSAGVIPVEDLLRAYVPVNGMIRIITEEKTSTVTSSNQRELRNLQTHYYSEQRNSIVHYDKGKYAFVSLPIIWLDGSVGNLQVVVSLEATQENLRILQIVLLVVTLVAMIPVVFSSRVLSNLVTKPVVSMIQTMKEIQVSGRYKKIELEKRSKDELFEMGETFNNMIELLEANYKKQEHFVSSASHELRTPLTIIESYASLLKRRGKERPDLFEESIQAIHSESIRMKEMTEQLLMLAKNQDQWNIKFEPVNLNGLIHEIVVSFQNAYQREVKVQMEENLTSYTDSSKLKQLLFIFMDNARKYSEDLIVLSVSKSKNETIIQVIDRGIGIPRADIDKVFDWFYRVDKARNRKIGGTGLGLSLAKEIADALNIALVLDSIEGSGTTVTLKLKNENKE